MDRVVAGALVVAGLAAAAWFAVAAGSAGLALQAMLPVLLPAAVAVLAGALLAEHARLRRSEARFRALVALSSDWYWETDAEHRLVRLEGGALPNARSLLGRRVWELDAEGADSARMREHRAQLERREPFSDLVLRTTGPDGEERWSSVSGEPVFGARGRFLGYRGTGRNLTAQKRAEERLFAEKERAQATLQAIGDAVIVADAGGWIEFMNPEAERLTGCELLQTAGVQVAAVLNLQDEASGAPLEDPVTQVLAGGIVVQGEGVVLERADGVRRLLDYSAAPIRDRAQRVAGVVVALRDVTCAREMAAKVSWQATHDELTGLVNRREFERRLGRALEEVQRAGAVHAVLFLDLDQFKVVNDTCGHVAGDELLRQLGQALARQVRQSDTLARLGGDEFGVLLAHCAIEQAARVAEALRRTVEQFHFAWQDKIFRVGVSIGGVALAEPAASLAEVMSAADAACYHAKDSGRNRVHLARAGDGEIAARHGQMQWVARIHRALEEDRLRLWYQEIRPISARALAGEGARGDRYELLLRMVDERGEPVPPMAFLPAAERYQLMPALDRWVVEHALEFLERCYGSGAQRLASASINLSAASVGDPKFLAFLERALARRRVAPQALCFEITETAAIANLACATRFISALRAIGCRFALDDFGAGMSSFAYLKNLPVDYLKIDGGFVKDMHREPIDAAMVEAIHRVGHVMGIATVAEFVENAQILERLRAIGVDYAQGYGIARPRPLDELAAAGLWAA